jgi:hypothetical protein
MKIFLYKTPYILYPFAVLVIIKLSAAYSGKTENREHLTLSWFITLIFFVPTLLGILCAPPCLSTTFDWWHNPDLFSLAAIATASGMVCAGLGGKHMKLGRKYRTIVSFAGVAIGAWTSVYIIYLAVMNRLLYGW